MDYRRPSGWYQTKDSTTAQHLDSPNTASPEPGATASVDGFGQIACPVGQSLDSNQWLAALNFNISIFYLKLCEAWHHLFPPHVAMVSVRRTIFYLRGKLVNLYFHPVEFQSDQTGLISEWWTEIIYIQVHLMVGCSSLLANWMLDEKESSYRQMTKACDTDNCQSTIVNGLFLILHFKFALYDSMTSYKRVEMLWLTENGLWKL